MKHVPRLKNIKLNKPSRVSGRKLRRVKVSGLNKAYIEDKLGTPARKPIVLPKPKHKKRKNKRIKGMVIKNRRN